MTAKLNGIRLWLYAGSLVVAAALAWGALKVQADSTARRVEAMDAEKLDRFQTQYEMQQFYERVIKPDLQRMEDRLLRELQEVKERIK